jgi:hypothetical protein
MKSRKPKPKAKPAKAAASSTPPPDRAVEIERLAALDPINYEVARTEEAKRLGLRTSALDRAVAKKRRALGLDTGDGDSGQGRAVKIVDVLPWPDFVDGDRVATTLAATVKTYAILPDTAADAIALWVLHTWLVNEFTMSPRLAVTSPTKGCGKTTVLRLLNTITRRPKRVGSISPPALFRAVEQFHPTILLDETEKYIEHGSDLHALLNEGHCQGATVWRVLGEKLELREFAIYGAVAFARNGRLPDDLEQRSIIVEMQRRLAGEPLAELREDRSESLLDVARMCARWAEDNTDEVGSANPDMGGIINRVRDNWRPLFAIADVIGEDWPERIREAAADLTPNDSESTGPMVLTDIKAALDTKGAERLASADYCEALNAMEGRPWAEWKAGHSASPKPLTPNQLARLLKPFHIYPETLRIGNRTAKGYCRHQFEEAWQRYLGSEGVSEPQHRNNADGIRTSATSQAATPAPEGDSKPSHRNKCDEIRTSGTFQTVTPESDVTVGKCEKPFNDGTCYGVTVEKGGNGSAGAFDAVLTAAKPTPESPPTASDPTPPASRAPAHARAKVAAANRGDDLTIPPFLDRRGEVCAQCGGSNGGELGAVVERDIGGVRHWLHESCNLEI